MRPEPFSIPSRDGRAQLTGDILVPERHREGPPLVLIVPGGWFMERDGFMGGSTDESALIYRALAVELFDRGFAVARYDNRGVLGHELSMKPVARDEDEFARSKRYVAECIDNEARRTVTPTTLCDDLESVVRHFVGRTGIDIDQTVLLAHSEGGIHACRLIGKRRIAPRGLVMFGTSAESPVAVFRWQCVDRYVEAVLSWDSDGDGRITADDVLAHYDTSLFPAAGVARDGLVPDEAWTAENLRARFEGDYDAVMSHAIATPPDAPYPDLDPSFDLVVAANAWWQQWFIDDISMLDHLREYHGEVCFHFGEIDGHLPVGRSISLVANSPFPCRPQAILHPGRGHALRTGEPSNGPMDDAAKRIIADSLEAIAAPVTSPESSSAGRSRPS